MMKFPRMLGGPPVVCLGDDIELTGMDGLWHLSLEGVLTLMRSQMFGVVDFI